MADPAPTPNIPLTPEGLPDWPAIDFDVHCSRCGYNLRTLTTPRCTECGFQFNWQELIRGLFNRNPRLFEHNWRERPIRSYLRAVFVPMFWPKSFWLEISLHDRIMRGPLLALLTLSCIQFLIVIHALSLIYWWSISYLFARRFVARPPYASWSRNSSLSLESVLDELERDFYYVGALPYEIPQQWWPLPLMLVAGLILMFLLMANLRETIARFKLRPAHMLRALAYASAPGLFLSAVVGSLFPVVLLGFDEHGLSTSLDVALFFGAIWLAGAPMFYQMRSSFRHYLKIPHAALAAGLLLITGILGAMALLLLLFSI